MNNKAVACSFMDLSLRLSQVAFAQRNDSSREFQQARRLRPNRLPHRSPTGRTRASITLSLCFKP